jgi:hypothetical protein
MVARVEPEALARVALQPAAVAMAVMGVWAVMEGAYRIMAAQGLAITPSPVTRLAGIASAGVVVRAAAMEARAGRTVPLAWVVLGVAFLICMVRSP